MLLWYRHWCSVISIVLFFVFGSNVLYTLFKNTPSKNIFECIYCIHTRHEYRFLHREICVQVFFLCRTNYNPFLTIGETICLGSEVTKFYCACISLVETSSSPVLSLFTSDVTPTVSDLRN